MQLQILGCGDAFGSGGRMNTCFYATTNRTCFLLDCGATSLVAMNRAGVARNDIPTILITHFHADHFLGLPFFLLDARLVSKRTAPLTIVGPRGLAERLAKAMDGAFPGATIDTPEFELTLLELEPQSTNNIGPLTVTPYQVDHGEPGGPWFGYRIETGGKTLAFSGDTQWTDTLIDLGKEVDLFIVETFTYERSVPYHMNLATLEQHLPDIAPKRLLLTHMSDDMLRHRHAVEHECAEDGLVLSV